MRAPSAAPTRKSLEAARTAAPSSFAEAASRSAISSAAAGSRSSVGSSTTRRSGSRTVARASVTRRRVTLARATVLEPELLVVDDPTEDLDPAAADEIADRLAAAAKELGAAVLAASNDFRVGAALGARTLLLASPVHP